MATKSNRVTLKDIKTGLTCYEVMSLGGRSELTKILIHGRPVEMKYSLGEGFHG